MRDIIYQYMILIKQNAKNVKLKDVNIVIMKEYVNNVKIIMILYLIIIK